VEYILLISGAYFTAFGKGAFPPTSSEALQSEPADSKASVLYWNATWRVYNVPETLTS
jgi:hypothetical protein